MIVQRSERARIQQALEVKQQLGRDASNDDLFGSSRVKANRFRQLF